MPTRPKPPDDPVADNVPLPDAVVVVEPLSSHSSGAVVGTTVVGATVVAEAVVVAPAVVVEPATVVVVD